MEASGVAGAAAAGEVPADPPGAAWPASGAGAAPLVEVPGTAGPAAAVGAAAGLPAGPPGVAVAGAAWPALGAGVAPLVDACAVAGGATLLAGELSADPLGAGAGAGGLGCRTLAGPDAAPSSAALALDTAAMRPPTVSPIELCALALATVWPALPRLPSVETALARPVLPCAPASFQAARVAAARPPVDLAAPTAVDAPNAPALTMPAPMAPAVAAAPPAVRVGLPDNIEAAIAGT